MQLPSEISLKLLCFLHFITFLKLTATPTTNDSGHIINVNNFEKLVETVKGFGKEYNPTSPQTVISNLEEPFAKPC